MIVYTVGWITLLLLTWVSMGLVGQFLIMKYGHPGPVYEEDFRMSLVLAPVCFIIGIGALFLSNFRAFEEHWLDFYNKIYQKRLTDAKKRQEDDLAETEEHQDE